jgi:hypothetical protein
MPEPRWPAWPQRSRSRATAPDACPSRLRTVYTAAAVASVPVPGTSASLRLTWPRAPGPPAGCRSRGTVTPPGVAPGAGGGVVATAATGEPEPDVPVPAETAPAGPEPEPDASAPAEPEPAEPEPDASAPAEPAGTSGHLIPVDNVVAWLAASCFWLPDVIPADASGDPECQWRLLESNIEANSVAAAGGGVGRVRTGSAPGRFRECG